METQYPSSFNSNLSWFSASTEWTKEENKKFESALAIYSEHDPEKWRKVAAMIPGKTVYDVIKQYRELEEDVGDIESGRNLQVTSDIRRFLMGLLEHGKGDWRNISRKFVVSKTPTQVASHAQKYFIRQQLSGSKDKRRPSIHDITTVNPTETTSQSHGNKLGVFNQFNVILPQQNPINMQNVLNFSLAGITQMMDQY
ncbi:hypothetical protein K2173_004868 [Erythroxylum novogranatense]|uniref:Uncharacterized protein n=1 Tax=Erythroxylum novogranatense TaxID=1862640 RepID=A0AAV8TCB3_9ROSI|nr:hypothetical protein K2173_004868 [Erythroxylum novogranatense]